MGICIARDAPQTGGVVSSGTKWHTEGDMDGWRQWKLLEDNEGQTWL